jgi:acyl-CoA thioester hydrolase
MSEAPPQDPRPQDDGLPVGRRDGPWVIHRHRVIYGDTDGMGIVYYANYLRFFEVGRSEYVRACGTTYRRMEDEHGVMLPVTEATAKYIASARYDDVLEIATRIEQCGHATLTFEYRITRLKDAALLAKGTTTHACLERASLRVIRIPKVVKDTLGVSAPPRQE